MYSLTRINCTLVESVSKLKSTQYNLESKVDNASHITNVDQPHRDKLDTVRIKWRIEAEWHTAKPMPCDCGVTRNRIEMGDDLFDHPGFHDAGDDKYSPVAGIGPIS
jgi:hypothetical protein